MFRRECIVELNSGQSESSSAFESSETSCSIPTNRETNSGSLHPFAASSFKISIACSFVNAALYERFVVKASKISTTCKIRANNGTASPSKRSG